MRGKDNNQRKNRFTGGGLFSGIFYLAWPMFVSGVLQNMQSLIDLFWVGRLGRNSVAAISLSGTVMMLMFPVILGLSTGVVAIVSRSVGSGDYGRAAETSGQALLAGLAFGIVAGAIGFIFAEDLLKILGGAPDVVGIGAEYLSISFLGLIPVFVFFMASSVLRASGNAVIPMLSMLAANLLNIALDPVLIFGLLGAPRLEARGAALATALSQAVAMMVICGLLFSGKYEGFRMQLRHFKPRVMVIWSLLRIGLPSSGQLLARSLMTLVLMRIVAGFGTAAVAAYGIGMRFHMMALMPAFALGGAATTMVGQNLGAANPGRAARAAWLATGICVLFMILVFFLLVPFAPVIARLFSASEDVIRISVSYLRIVTPFYVFVAFSIVLGRAVNGAGDTVPPMITTILALWVFQVPLALLLPKVFCPPTNGIWFAIGVAVTIHGVMNAAWFISGKWKHKKV